MDRVALRQRAQRRMPLLAQVGAIEPRQALLHQPDALDHPLRRRVVQRCAGARQPDCDARDQPLHDEHHLLGARPAHIAIARHLRQRRQRAHEVAHICGDGGLRLDAPQQERDSLWQLRQHDAVQ